MYIHRGLAVGVGFGSVASGTSSFQSAVNLALGIGIQNFPEGTYTPSRDHVTMQPYMQTCMQQASTHAQTVRVSSDVDVDVEETYTQNTHGGKHAYKKHMQTPREFHRMYAHVTGIHNTHNTHTRRSGRVSTFDAAGIQQVEGCVVRAAQWNGGANR